MRKSIFPLAARKCHWRQEVLTAFVSPHDLQARQSQIVHTNHECKIFVGYYAKTTGIIQLVRLLTTPLSDDTGRIDAPQCQGLTETFSNYQLFFHVNWIFMIEFDIGNCFLIEIKISIIIFCTTCSLSYKTADNDSS